MNRQEIDKIVNDLEELAKLDVCHNIKKCPYEDIDDIEINCGVCCSLYMVERFKEILYNGND